MSLHILVKITHELLKLDFVREEVECIRHFHEAGGRQIPVKVFVDLAGNLTPESLSLS
jgi:hypothetical protein